MSIKKYKNIKKTIYFSEYSKYNENNNGNTVIEFYNYFHEFPRGRTEDVMFKIGIVGAGIIAKPHKGAVLKHPEAELVAICDIAEEKAQELAVDTDARIYKDYKEMAEKEELDAVILNLPHFLHKPVTVYFLERGVAVLVEKPMANTVEECEEMAAAAKRTGTVLAVGHLQRYFECYKEIKRIMADGRYGNLCCVTETRNIDYFTNRPAWFLKKETAGGGIVMNYCAHTLDKMFYLLDDTKVQRICANVGNRLNDADIEAHAQVLMKMENGVSLSFSYCSSRLDYSYETIFYFTDGIAKVTGGVHLWVAQKGKPFERVDLDYKKVTIEEQFEEFVKLLKGEPANIVDAEMGKRVISVIEEIFRQG